MTNEKTKLICVRLTESIVEEIDEEVKDSEYLDRSKFIRKAIVKELGK